MLKHLLMTLAILGFAGSAVAQDTATESNTSTTTLEESDKGLTEILPTEKDLDQEITNARLRAESGSKSQWSMSFDLSYYGGSLADPASESRPNYRRGLTPAVVFANADIKGRYRLNKNSSLALGTGMTIVRPFHGALDTTDTARDATSLSNPYLTWSSYYQQLGMQMSSSASLSYYTVEEYTAQGATGHLSLSQSILSTFLNDRLTMGVSVAGTFYQVDNSLAQFETYNDYLVRNNQDPTTLEKFEEGSTDIGLGVYPFAEYTLNDTFAVRTVFGYFNFEHAKGADSIVQSDPYQSLGIAMSLSRNVYVYPNIQFIPTEVREDRTNVAVSATINAF